MIAWKTLIKLTVFFLISGLCNVTVLQAQNHTFKHSTTRDGLPSGFVWDMMQDEKGFVWIGTISGLSRFDGYEFVNYRPDSNTSGSISGQIIYSIKEYDSSTYLIGTDAALNIYNPVQEIFSRVNVPETVPDIYMVRDIKVMESGDIWVAAADGLYHIPSQDLKSELLNIHFYAYEKDPGDESIFGFTSLDYDGKHTLWLGSATNLHKFDLDSRQYVEREVFDEVTEDIVKSQIWSIHVARNGTMIISSINGLVVWKQGEVKPAAVTELGPYNREALAAAGFQSVTEDDEGRIWLGTGTLGAIRWDLTTDEIVTYRHDPANDNTISSDDVHFAFEDSQGNIWFGYHFNGISAMFHQNWMYTYSLATDEFGPDHNANRLIQVIEDESGNLWFPTSAGLVYHPVNGDAAITYTPGEEILDDGGFGMAIVSENVVFLSSGNGNRIYTFDTQEKTFADVSQGDSLNMLPLYAEETSTGYYFPSNTGEIVRVDKLTFESERIRVPYTEGVESLAKPVLPAIDSEGNFLVFLAHFRPGAEIISDNFIYDPDDKTFTRVDIRLPVNTTNLSRPSVSHHQPGVLWMRLHNGIFRQNYLTGETANLFQSESGIINDGSGLIYEDADGYLWMGGNTGIMKLDPVTESITFFEADQNRKPNEIAIPFPMRNGDILFTGDGGYIRFNPEEQLLNEPIAKIHITEFGTGSNLHQTLYSDAAEFEIESSDNNLAFSFIGLNYRDPTFTRYRYRIDGYDADWNMIGSQRRVFLANMPPGEYTFQVQAAPRYGAFSESMALGRFTILPPWWKTMPAYFLYFILFVAGVVAVDRVQRRRVVMKERERAREKELAQAREIEIAYKNLKAAQEQLIQQEKLASLGQLTAGIAHEIKNPLNFVNNFSEVSLEMIDEALEEIRQIGGNKHAEETAVILADIKSNLTKIHDHGSRADGIVKSMLLHSRGGSGEMVPTDLNDVVKEYVNLAYHGMRAGKNPINADIDIQLDETVGEIPIITEDFSRVILNLCNNAFDAMRETMEIHSPSLRVRTKKSGDSVSIEIEDNGPGIPDDIKDKILQPFFTTKKGTQGTGLGLSITNDIVKAHGGVLEIESEPGKAVFIIKL